MNGLQRRWAARIQEVRYAGGTNAKHSAALGAAHFSSEVLLNRLRAEIEVPSQLRYVRLQALPNRFWREFLGDQGWVPLKLLLLAALLLLTALI